MKAVLRYLEAELRLKITTLCHHLRNKAYAQNSEELYSAMSSMIFYQLLVDELSQLLYANEQLILAMEKYVKGEKYEEHVKGLTDQEPIYEFCLNYFVAELPLGSATPELTQWVATHADRNQTIRKGFYSFFPGVEFKVEERDEAGAVELRPASEAEKFESDTRGFLRDIESSNALNEFNLLMRQVRQLLEQKAPIENILIILNSDKRQ